MLLAPLIIVSIAAAIVLLCFQSHSLQNYSLNDGQAAFWNAVIKAVAGAVTLIGGLLAVTKYLVEQSRANEAALIAANKPFAERQQAIYYELCSVTASIANRNPDDPVRWRAEAKFWELFWGALPMVADLQVGAAANRFSEALDRRGDMVPLRNASMSLARACRDSLGFVRAAGGRR